MDGAEIVGGRGAGASFIRATLTDAVFRSLAPYERDDQETHANELDLAQADFELAKVGDVQFVGCDLAQAELRGIQAPHAVFQACDIRDAVFAPSDAEDVPALLRRSDLRNVDFDHMCSLDNARFDDANLEHVSFMCRNVPGISLRNAVAQNATFQHCRFNEADFLSADLSNADLGGADLRTALGVTLDRCYTRDARLPTGDADPWSTLRSEYTGSRLMFNLIFLAVFVAPLVGKAVAMSGLNGVQQDLAERAEVLLESVDNATSSASETSSMARALGAAARWPGPDFVEVPLGFVVLGVDQGVLYSLFVVGPVLAYQLLRAGLTWLVSRMSDDENQTGYSPAYRPEPLACPRGVRCVAWR